MIPSHEADLSSESQGRKRGYSQQRDGAEESGHLYVYRVVCTLLRQGCQRNWKKSKGATKDLKLVMMNSHPQLEGFRASANQKRLKVPDVDNKA